MLTRYFDLLATPGITLGWSLPSNSPTTAIITGAQVSPGSQGGSKAANIEKLLSEATAGAVLGLSFDPRTLFAGQAGMVLRCVQCLWSLSTRGVGTSNVGPVTLGDDTESVTLDEAEEIALANGSLVDAATAEAVGPGDLDVTQELWELAIPISITDTGEEGGIVGVYVNAVMLKTVWSYVREVSCGA